MKFKFSSGNGDCYIQCIGQTDSGLEFGEYGVVQDRTSISYISIRSEV